MGKYVSANKQPLVSLKYNPYQVEALKALAARHCPKSACGFEWAVQFGDPATTYCPRCHTLGERDFTRIALIAGRQGGKTRWGTLAVVLELAMPDVYWWVTAPTYRDLTDYVEPAFFAQIPQDWVDRGDWSASDRILTLPNRAVCAFRSLEDPETLRGPTLDGMLMDEACKVAGKAYMIGNAMLMIKHGVWLFTTTPKGEDWVHEQITQAAEAGEPGFWVASYKSIENPITTPEFIEQQRRQMSPEMFRQEYEASIEVFQGAIYSGLVTPCVIDDVSPHTRDAAFEKLQTLLPEWPKLDAGRLAIVGIDPGSDHPFAGVLLIITSDAIIAVGEYEEREKPAMIHAANLRAMTGPLTPRWGVDRSQAQMIIELGQHGIYAQAVEGGPGSVMAGIERVKSWMLSGRFYIVKSRCPRLIKSLIAYRWAETEKADGSTGQQQPYKRKDDLPDALRYAFQLWPHLPEPLVPATGRDLSKLPDKMRRDIERVLRGVQSKGSEESIADGVGEFYTRVDDSLVAAGPDSGGVFDHFDEFYG